MGTSQHQRRHMLQLWNKQTSDQRLSKTRSNWDISGFIIPWPTGVRLYFTWMICHAFLWFLCAFQELFKKETILMNRDFLFLNIQYTQKWKSHCNIKKSCAVWPNGRNNETKDKAPYVNVPFRARPGASGPFGALVWWCAWGARLPLLCLLIEIEKEVYFLRLSPVHEDVTDVLFLLSYPLFMSISLMVLKYIFMIQEICFGKKTFL